MSATVDIAGLAEARKVLGDAVLGPAELAAVLGFDPLGVLDATERAAVARVTFSPDTLARARAAGEILVLRIPRTPDGPLTMLSLVARLGAGLDPRAHKGVGYMLRPEWTIDEQPFATTETCAAGWSLVRREPLPETLNRPFLQQETVLHDTDPTRPRRRSAVDIAFDTLCWHRARGERLLAGTWDWSRSVSTDQGNVALGEFGPDGIRVTAYSHAVRFGTLGVCAQRPATMSRGGPDPSR